MDPVTAQLILKGLDLAFVGLMLLSRYEEAQDDAAAALEQVVSFRRKIEEGELSPEEIKARAEEIAATITAPMDKALSRL